MCMSVCVCVDECLCVLVCIYVRKCVYVGVGVGVKCYELSYETVFTIEVAG